MTVLNALVAILSIIAQTTEVTLPTPQAKITTVSAMRVRRGPGIASEELMRLKLATIVTATARSSTQDTISGKTDFWYNVKLPKGETGWLFGGFLLDYTLDRREPLLRQIIETRLKSENTDFSDREEVFNLAATALSEAKDPNTRAEFELLKLLALANWAVVVRDNLREKSPYREWHIAHGIEVILNEFGGGYNLRTELLWQLEAKYHTLPIADRVAWEAAQNPQPSDCEGDDVCNFFLYEGEIKYLSLHPTGAHAIQALTHLNEALTDEVINRANAKGGDKYAVEQRAELKKIFASLRLVLMKVSASEKREILQKLSRVAVAG